MLKSLAISNFAVIRRLSVDFHTGLTTLTGETGAGKSILVGALGLLCGSRGGADLLRTGEERLRVEGLFEVAPDSAAGRWVENHFAEQAGAGEILLRRELARDGRSRAWIGESPLTLAALRQLGALLVQLQGQHGQHELLSTSGQRDWLDAWAGLQGRRAEVAALYDRMRRLEQELTRVGELERERLQRADLLRFQVQEIEQARLATGEDEALGVERQRLRHAERLRQASAEVLQALYEDDLSAASLLGRARARMQEMCGVDPQVGAGRDLLDEAAARVDEVARMLAAYQEGLEAEPGRLEQLEERHRTLESLKRKYGATLDEVLAFGRARRDDLAQLEDLAQDRASLEADLGQSRSLYWEAAQELSNSRRQAAKELSAVVARELAVLAMPRARFEIGFAHPAPPWDFERRPEAGAAGADELEFRLAANVGEEERPLARVASGGELSRVLLALHVSAEQEGEPRALVYDEIDAGVGADVAIAVGERLRRVAKRHQVLCVTHMHPIAAVADHHYRIEKMVARGRTEVRIRELDVAQRVEEVTRMMGGKRAGEVGRRAAAEWVRRREVTSS